MLMIFSTLAVSAQKKISERSDLRTEMRSDYTPEQRATLKAKKMTLMLDLNTSQQNKLEKLFLENTKSQKNKTDWKSMTSEEKFSSKNEYLDRRIENKAKIKQILTADQYDKWQMNQSKSNRHGYKGNHARQLNKE